MRVVIKIPKGPDKHVAVTSLWHKQNTKKKSSMAERNIISETVGRLYVAFNPKIDIMEIGYHYPENQGYDFGEDDDVYDFVWFVTEKGRRNSVEVTDWREYWINHIDELAKAISQKTSWSEKDMAHMLKNVSKKGKHIRPFWENHSA